MDFISDTETVATGQDIVRYDQGPSFLAMPLQLDLFDGYGNGIRNEHAWTAKRVSCTPLDGPSECEWKFYTVSGHENAKHLGMFICELSEHRQLMMRTCCCPETV